MSKASIKRPEVLSTLDLTRRKTWRRWIFAFAGYEILGNTSVTSAIWMIYLAAHGYNPLTIGLLEMLFHIAKFVAEVPTGIFADQLGRRKSLIAYCILGAVETALILTLNLPLMITGFALSGIAYAFRGGADSAILWNIAGYIDTEEQATYYSKLYSRMFVIGLIGQVVGTATGGYLGKILMALPFIVQIGINLACIIPLLFIPEQMADSKPETRLNPFSHLAKGLSIVWNTPTVLGLILISGLTESCWQTVYFYFQLYLHGLGSSLEIVGLVIAGGMGTSALFTWMAPWIMRHIARRWLVPGFFGMEILGLLLMSVPWLWLCLIGYLVFFQASISVLDPAINTYVNERLPEEQRATVLSFQTGLFSAAMIVMFPLFGQGVSYASYSTVYLWMLAALCVGGAGIWGLERVRQDFRQ